ncbi:MAG: hypothetical protein IIV77_03375 [Bacteroidaceae bacterium]|nr:hypothetical protein [Bacteroidaceae bacterium]
MKRIFRIWLPLLLSGIFISCIDDKYDLDNIDMTIGTSGDLKVPTSSTGEIILKNIMDLKEDGIVQIIDGGYHIEKVGSADIPEININDVKIKSPDFNKITCDITLNKEDLDVPTEQRRKSLAPQNNKDSGVEIGGVIIPSRVFRYTIEDLDKTSTKLESTSDPISSDVVALKEVKFKDDTTLEIDIMTKLANNSEFFKLVHLDDLFITYPKGLHIEDVQCEHWSINDDEEDKIDDENRVYGEEYLHKHPAVKIDNENGILDLTNGGNVEIGEERPGIYRSIRVKIKFDKASFYENDELKFDEKNQIVLQGAFKVGGTFRVETEDLKLLEKIYKDENERREIIAKLVGKFTEGGINSIIPDMISFTGEARFDSEEIEITGAMATVQRKVDNINPIELNDLPDFLNDPEVVLDLENPIIYVNINNPLPAAAETEITLKSLYDTDTEVVEKKTGKIIIPANKQTIYCLCMPGRFKSDMKHPKEYYVDEDEEKGLVAEIKPIEIADLNLLLKKIPQKIEVDVATITMDVENGYLPIPSSYKVNVDYKIYTPLEYGNEFTLVYQGTEDGLSEDLADINTLDTKEVRIDAKAVTNFPMDLTLSVDALDRNNVSMKGKIIEVDDIKINAHNGKDFSVQPISLTIKPVKGHTISEMLQRLDKFHYRAVAEAKGEGKLMENVSIKLTDINITLKGGISYDAN